MKKLLSLFTILCCVMTLVCIPVAVEATVATVAFSDNFETETEGAVPSNWEVYNNQTSTTSLTVQKDTDGNKFLRMQKIDSTWGGEIIASTKDGVVSLPTANSKIIVKMKMRGSDMRTGVSARHTVRLAYPKATNGTAHSDNGGNQYLLWAMRTHSTKVNNTQVASFCVQDEDNNVTDTNFVTSEKTWYDVEAVVDYETETIDYIIGNSDIGYQSFSADFGNASLGELSLINNITIKLTNGTQNFYTDIDDVSIKYLTTSRSFSDDFQNETANKAPSNWRDNNGVASLTVMEETDGNKYLRINKTTGTGVPLVSTMTGLINMPYNENNGKGIVVEAKIRQQNTDFRSLLMLNAPDSITDTEYGSNKYTPFYISTDLNAYFMPDYKKVTVEKEKWVTYRAVIIPGIEQTEIRHYINGSKKATTYADGAADDYTGLFNPAVLENVVFTWRPSSGAASTAEGVGYMDIDDISVYEIADVAPTVTFKNEEGNSGIANGKVTADITVINKDHARKFDIYGALYNKDGSTWKLANVVNKTLTNYSFMTGKTSIDFNVTDATNQMIKVFVWYDSVDENDDNVFETSLKLQPVCAPFELSAQN